MGLPLLAALVTAGGGGGLPRVARVRYHRCHRTGARGLRVLLPRPLPARDGLPPPRVRPVRERRRQACSHRASDAHAAGPTRHCRPRRRRAGPIWHQPVLRASRAAPDAPARRIAPTAAALQDAPQFGTDLRAHHDWMRRALVSRQRTSPFAVLALCVTPSRCPATSWEGGPQ